MKKRYAATLVAVLSMLVLALSACGGGGAEGPIIDLGDLSDIMGGGGDGHVELGWTGLDFNHEGQITLGFWGLGPANYVRDVGRVDHDPTTMARHTSSVMAAAQLFNYTFPNVTINADNGSTATASSRNNFYMEHGYRVDTWMTINITDEIVGGHITDLSIFSDDPILDLLNPTIMRMITHLDRLWALPTLTIPWGIFVNNTLAENQNLDTPPVDWTMEEFMDFVSNSRADEFFGGLGIPWPIMETMTLDYHYQLLFRQPGEPFVRVDTPGIRAVNAMGPRVMHHTFFTNSASGNISQSFRDQFSNSPWLMFAQGAFLTFYAQPWSMSYAAVEGHASRIQVPDWDYFPRPSTEWVGNHVGTAMDIMPIRNVAMDDGDPMLNWEEYDHLRLVWEFLRFYTVDLRSWQARSDMLWGPDLTQSAKTESLPYTIGQLYYDMLDIHFQAPERRVFADARSFPAYHYIMQLWEEGATWGLWELAFPFYAPWEGGTRRIDHEWRTRWSAASVGAHETDPSWYDQLLGRLPVWDVEFNQRWEARYEDLLEATFRFHPPQRRLSRS